MARLIRCSGCTRRPNGCQIRRRFRPRPKRLSWRLQPPQRPPPATDTSRPRRQPGCTHPLSLSSFTAERKKEKQESPFPSHFFFFCSFARRVSPTSRCQTWKNFVHRRSFSLFHSEKQQKQKKDFFFHISKADYCVSWFLFQCDAYPSFLLLEKKKQKNCNPNTNLNSVKLLPFPPLPFNHTRTCFFFLLSLEFPHQSMAFEICVSRRQFHQETN